MGNKSNNMENVSFDIKQLYKLYRQSYTVNDNQYFNTEYQKISEKNKKIIINSLFQSFLALDQYQWGQQLYPLFQNYFYQGFQKIWAFNREQFYQNLIMLTYPNGQRQKQIIKSQIKKQAMNKISFQTFFYNQGPGKKKSTNSIISKQVKMKQSINAINSSILQLGGDCFPQCSKLSFVQKCIQLQPGQKFQSQFYHPKSHINNQVEVTQVQCQSVSQIKFDKKKVQNSSIIIPQTVFVDRLNQQEQNEIDQFVNFYRVFSDGILQVINSISLVSCPLKHFQICISLKMNRKKIQKKASMSKSPKILKNTKEARQMRLKRQFNNNLLLIQVKDFTQAYAEFIWKYLNLSLLEETYIGTLITIDTVYNIVLKSVWGVCGWLGIRGCQWEQDKLPQIIQKIQAKDFDVPKKLIQQCQFLSEQTNPIHYFKKIVFLYRQTSKLCPNADKLLDYLQKIVVQTIKNKKHYGILRMSNIIQKLVKMDESNGEISYAWTTWSILIEMLKSKLDQLVAQKAIEYQYLIIDK